MVSTLQLNLYEMRFLHMEKTTTLNLRVNPLVKQRAEEVLSQLGMPMSTAIDIYLHQISLTGSIPFKIALPQAPAEVDAERMSAEQLREKLQKGYDEIEAGRFQVAETVFAQRRK